MTTTHRIAAFFVACALAFCGTADAAFQNPIQSPESAALGGASLTASHDSSSLFVNPAQLARMRQADFYFMYDQMYAGLEGVGTIGQGFLSGGLPTRFGTFAMGMGMFRAAGLIEERTLSFAYGKQLSDRVDFGVVAKQLYHNYLINGDALAQQDPIFAHGHSASGFALDLGVVGHVTRRFNLGLAIRNLNRPDVGLATEDRVPREIQGGASYEFPSRHIRVTGDLTYRDNDAGRLRDHLTPAVGIEKSFEQDRFVFRLGATPDSFSAGFGLRWGPVGLDYALVLNRNLIQGNVGTHQLGLRIRFGGPKAAAAVAAGERLTPAIVAAVPARAPGAAPAVPIEPSVQATPAPAPAPAPAAPLTAVEGSMDAAPAPINAAAPLPPAAQDGMR
jgi:hypothetical protein